MTSDWPSGLDQFGEFLQKQSLSFERRGTVPHTGDKLWQYGTNKIGVRVVADRGVVWSVRVADIAGWPQQWYAACELRELLTGTSDVWPSAEQDDGIGEQMRFVEKHWPAIVAAFGADKGPETHERLKELAQERSKRKYWR
jgi:hypothetical protein